MKKFLTTGLVLTFSILAQAQTLVVDWISSNSGNYNNKFQAIEKTADESFICLGSEEQYNGTKTAFLAKFTDLDNDQSFGINGFVRLNDLNIVNSFYSALMLQSDGKILVGGKHDDGATHTYSVRRYNDDGTPDNTFGNNGATPIFNTLGNNGYISNISIQTDGKILVSNKADAGDPGITRLDANGSLDNTFGTNGLANPGSGISGIFYNYVKALNNGKILVAAYINDISGNTIEIMVYRLNSNGTTDPTFGVNGKFNYTLPGQVLEIQNLNLQSDGKIIVGGYSYDPTSSSGDRKLMLIRLLSNGSRDNTFGTQGVATMTPESGNIKATGVYLLNDDKLIFNYYNSDSLYSGLVKFSATGMPDLTFNNNTAIKIVRDLQMDHFISDFEVTSDQKIIFAGMSYATIIGQQYTSLIGRLRYVGTGISDAFQDLASIYPNPANDKLYINLKSGTATATVFDLSGKKVKEQKIYKNGTLNLTQLNSGAYLLHLNSGTNSAAQQFSIIR